MGQLYDCEVSMKDTSKFDPCQTATEHTAAQAVFLGMYGMRLVL